MAIFDITRPDQFFIIIEQTFRDYQTADRVKSTKDILFVIMGLNHLREWIKKWPSAHPDANEFSDRLLKDTDYGMINSLCNGIKHICQAPTTSTIHDTTMDEWTNVDDVLDFDKGPPTAHFIENEPVEAVIQRVIDLYKEWFNQHS